MKTCSIDYSEKIQKAHGAIDKHLEELTEQMRQGKSEHLVRYLEFAAQFHHYSFGNLLLALSQKPNITRLAGIRQWNKLGRYVRAGEKGIMIFAPMLLRRKNDQETSPEEEAEPDDILLRYKIVHVFDVSQTEGQPLPTIIHATGDALALLPALQAAIARDEIALEFVECIPGLPTARGVSCGGRVIIRSDQSPADTFRTLVHEYAHEKYHKQASTADKTIKETEADATAFVVCRHFGVDCDTSDYLLLYDSSPKVLLERLETIRSTANEIIGAITGLLPDDALENYGPGEAA